MVCNCRAEISPRPVSQDVHLCTTFYLYRLNYVAHALQILCFCQQLVCFWGDKSHTDDKQPISVSVDSVRLDTLQIVIAHTGISRVTTPERLTTPHRIWIMIYPSVISLDNCTATAITSIHVPHLIRYRGGSVLSRYPRRDFSPAFLYHYRFVCWVAHLNFGN